MKKIVILISLSILFTFSVKCQEIINNFQVEENEVKWQKVIENSLRNEEIIEKIKDSGIIENISIGDNKISGDLKSIEADYKGAGFSEMRTPMIIARSFINGFVIIEFKEAKYRITIKNIVFTQKYDDPLMKQGEKTTIETIGLNRRNEFTNAFRKSASEILNYTFSKKFDFTETKSDNW